MLATTTMLQTCRGCRAWIRFHGEQGFCEGPPLQLRPAELGLQLGNAAWGTHSIPARLALQQAESPELTRNFSFLNRTISSQALATI